MNPLNTIRRGLIAAVPVCLVVVAILLIRADAIENAKSAAIGLGGDTATGWIGTWIIITLVFGVVASSVYDYLSTRWGWNGSEYLSFAVSLAVALSALAFLQIYAGEMHPFRIEYSALNFAYAFGFGCAIPVLTATHSRKRTIGAKASPTSQ